VRGLGVAVGGVKKVKKAFQAVRNVRKRRQKGQFPTLLALKIAQKKTFFNQKLLNKIYSQDVFKKYINFKIFRNLRRCGVIPVQSFGSHIRPQPPRLGLKQKLISFNGSILCF
jgi:hypothetical protein